MKKRKPPRDHLFTADLRRGIESRGKSAVQLALGDVALSWLRGESAGIARAADWLKKNHPKAAKALRENFL